jgi:type 1 glutamine amidotransferase
MRIAVITGHHGFDVVAFHDLFRRMEGIDAYVQPLEDWSREVAGGRAYDAHVFYNMHRMAPEEAPGGEATRRAIDSLGHGAGIVVLHHAILAFEGDAVWDDIVGMSGTRMIDGYEHDERLQVRIADGEHPITAGLTDFDIIDETYDYRDVEGADSRVLLTVEHRNSMSTLAWTRQYKESRVFNLVLGHDGQAFENPTFQQVLRRGICWSAGTL